MRQSDRVMRLVSLLVFIAMAAYLAVYVVNRFVDPVQTALVVTATMSDATPITGLVVRDEVLIEADDEYINVIVDDGEKISAGQTVAIVYGSAEALEQAVRLESLEEEIETVSEALSADDGVYSTNREQAIHTALLSLSSAVRSGNYARVDTHQNALRSLLFRTEAAAATESYLDELQAAYDSLKSGAQSGMRAVVVAQSGTYSPVVDGLEGVSPDYAAGLKPDELRELIAAERSAAEGVIGKLVTSFSWCYAAIVDADEVTLAEGDEVTLAFGRYTTGSIPATVASVGRRVNGERIIVFRMDRELSDTLAVRSVSASLINRRYEGLRVPVRSLYRYYAGYLTDDAASRLSVGDTVTLTLGGVDFDAFVSELGSSQRYGALPDGVTAGSDGDVRPTRRLVVFCWPWSADEPAPDFSAGGGTVTLSHGRDAAPVLNYYAYDSEVDRLCVFSVAAMQAERKKVGLVYAGEEYCLLSSEGVDALREGSEVIVQAAGLYSGKVIQ